MTDPVHDLSAALTRALAALDSEAEAADNWRPMPPGVPHGAWIRLRNECREVLELARLYEQTKNPQHREATAGEG